jgi:hypothetical protein
MNNSKHLKKKKILIQFSDGSSSSLFCYVHKKEFLVESDIKSNLIWKNVVESLESDKIKYNNLYNYNKLFSKTK